VKNTIRIQSGTYLDLLDPQPEQFTISDIAGALSRICRFGGQVAEFYSVAEHSVHCANIARNDGLSIEVQRAALMHDAAEAFCGDVVKPLKVMLRGYAEVERRIEDCIGRKFGIDFAAHKDAVREIDRSMLIAERRSLFSADVVEWTGENQVKKVSVPFYLWRPTDAEHAFTQLASYLGIERRLTEPNYGRGAK
jgi:5'-deoxynucleotidase YfbR-like HD superfamily hydrolase